MEDKPDYKTVQWNAGSEYNDLIKTIKENYIIAELNKDYKSALTTLSTDFDFSYNKILSESKKQGKEKEIKKKAKKIRTLVDSAQNFVNTKQNYPNYENQIIKKLSVLKRVIWDMQGAYGVLYPFQEIKHNNPGDAIKHGFS